MRHRFLSLILLVFVLVAVRPDCSFAQSKMDQATANATAAAEASEARAPAKEAAPTPEKRGTTAMPATPDSVVLGDPVTRQRYLDAMQRYYQYRANGYEYRSRVFEWQLLSSRVIFIVVLALVSAGIYFAAVQFRVAMRAAMRPATAVESTTRPTQAATLATTLEVSAKGIVVNSSVMGLIILALSLAFFYLYLVYVYPINDVL